MELGLFKMFATAEVDTHFLLINIPVSQLGSARTKLQGKITQSSCW